jgi:hypothetical protein
MLVSSYNQDPIGWYTGAAAQEGLRMDLYHRLAKPVVRLSAGSAHLAAKQSDSEPDPEPWTIHTRTIETTDEAGTCMLLKCVAP